MGVGHNIVEVAFQVLVSRLMYMYPSHFNGGGAQHSGGCLPGVMGVNSLHTSL